jgi:hypothetical protein
MKKTIRISLFTLAIFMVIYFVMDVFLWITYNPSKHEAEIAKIVEEAKQLKPFPEKIYEAYTKVYPGWEKEYIVPDIIWIGTAKTYSNYPQCFTASKLARGNRFEIFMCANEIENHLTNKQCLTHMLSQFDWYHRGVGLEKAAQIYYKKTIEDLTYNESLELMVMIENPSLYNKFTHPEALGKRMLKFK